MASAQDCARVEAEIERSSEQTKKASRGWVYANKKSLMEAPWHYSAADADQVLKDAVAKGRSIPDENFPDDKEKAMCLVRERVKFEDENVYKEKLGAKAAVPMDSAMSASLLGADGILQPSGVPDVFGLSESAMAAFAIENLHGVSAAGAAAAKAKAKAKGKAKAARVTEAGAAVVTPTQVLANAKAMQQEFLNEATDAGKMALTITTYGLSSEIGAEMKQHKRVLLQYYKRIGKMIAENEEEQENYEEQIYQFTRPLQQWYVNRAPSAKSLCKSVSKGAKKVVAKKEEEEEEADGTEDLCVLCPCVYKHARVCVCARADACARCVAHLHSQAAPQG